MELKQGTSRWRKLWSAKKTSPCNLRVPNSDDPRKWCWCNIHQIIRSKMDFENIERKKGHQLLRKWRLKIQIWEFSGSIVLKFLSCLAIANFLSTSFLAPPLPPIVYLGSISKLTSHWYKRYHNRQTSTHGMQGHKKLVLSDNCLSIVIRDKGGSLYKICFFRGLIGSRHCYRATFVNMV